MGILSKLFNLNVKTVEEEAIQKEKVHQINTDGPFSMTVESVFCITGRGTVVVGKISQGIIKIGDTVKIKGIPSTVKGIEVFRKQLDYASIGDNVGILLDQIDQNQVSEGDLITK